MGEAQKLTAPAPFALLSVLREDGGTNLAAVSWWTYLTNHPPMLGVCLGKKGYSGGRIAATGEFALSLPGEELRAAALRCGQCSGRSVDKVQEFGIPMEAALFVTPRVVSGSRVIFECKLENAVDAGDHTLYIGRVEAVRGDPDVPQLFAWGGYAELKTL